MTREQRAALLIGVAVGAWYTTIVAGWILTEDGTWAWGLLPPPIAAVIVGGVALASRFIDREDS